MRRRTRGLKVSVRDRGKVKISKYLAEFPIDTKVSINVDPSFQSIPHPRYNGRTGKVVGQQGRAFLVEIKDGGKSKQVIVNPEHLTKQGG